MDTKNIKLFDANNHLVDNFDDEIERVLISIHGKNYYDTDEELVNTNLIPIQNDEIYKDGELDKTIEIINGMVDKNSPKIKIVEKKNKKVGFNDFIPVLFFLLVFLIIVVAGYYFLNTVDLMSLIK